MQNYPLEVQRQIDSFSDWVLRCGLEPPLAKPTFAKCYELKKPNQTPKTQRPTFRHDPQTPQARTVNPGRGGRPIGTLPDPGAPLILGPPPFLAVLVLWLRLFVVVVGLDSPGPCARPPDAGPPSAEYPSDALDVFSLNFGGVFGGRDPQSARLPRRHPLRGQSHIGQTLFLLRPSQLRPGCPDLVLLNPGPKFSPKSVSSGWPKSVKFVWPKSDGPKPDWPKSVKQGWPKLVWRRFGQRRHQPVRRGKQPNIVIAVCARMSSVDCFLNLF